MYTELPLAEIRFRDDNPRRHFCGEKLKALSESIRVAGVLEPVVVRTTEEGEHELVAGERRCRAAVMAGLREIPARVLNLSDVEVAQIQLAENVARSNMSPMEEHAGVSRLIELGEEIAHVAQVTGRSAEWCQLRLDLGVLPEPIKQGLDGGGICIGIARELLGLSEQEREKASQTVLDLGDEATAKRVKDMLELRYHAPRRRAARWAKRKAKLEAQGFSPIDHPDESERYVRSWGDAVAPFAHLTDRLGAKAARAEDEGLTWEQLLDGAEYKVPVLIVPGLDLKTEHRMIDSRPLVAAENARRKAGEPYTLGPRGAKRESERLAEQEAAEAEVIDPEGVFLRFGLAFGLEAREWLEGLMGELYDKWSESNPEFLVSFLEGVELGIQAHKLAEEGVEG